MIKIYHNSKCKKSREGLQFLEGISDDYQIVDYINNPLTKAEIQELLQMLGKKPEEIIRTQEAVYKSEHKGKNYSDEEWIRILAQNPKLIQRPIVVNKGRAVIAQPPDRINEIL